MFDGEANMNRLLRKKVVCEVHDWATTVNAGLRRSICRACGEISLGTVTIDLTISETLKRAAETAR